MKRGLLAAAALVLPLRAALAAPDLASLRSAWGKHEDSFSSPAAGPAGQLTVTATEAFLESGAEDRNAALESLAADWRKASPEDPLLLEVRWRYGGWLWRGKRDAKTGRERVALVDRWDDAAFPWVQDAQARGKWFLFFGGQSMSGGGLGTSAGFNARVGTTFFRDRYDAAFTFNRSATDTGAGPKIKLTAVGFLGRALFRVPDTSWGYNLGGGVTVISGSNFDTENEVSALAGLNYYQQRGTWDVSLNFGDEGTRTLILGYSLFLNR
jgi:hypothetical protein